MNSYIHATLAILVLINPIICVAMLMQVQPDSNVRVKIANGIKAMLAVLAILLISAVLGHYILNAFGISMDAFKVVGGFILAVIGIQMLSPKQGGDGDGQNDGIIPLILFAASPGTITMVITLAATYSADGLPIEAIIGASVAVAITILIIVLSVLLAGNKKMKQGGLISSYLGVIIMAMGIQFVLDGLKAFFT